MDCYDFEDSFYLEANYMADPSYYPSFLLIFLVSFAFDCSDLFLSAPRPL